MYIYLLHICIIQIQYTYKTYACPATRRLAVRDVAAVYIIISYHRHNIAFIIVLARTCQRVVLTCPFCFYLLPGSMLAKRNWTTSISRILTCS